MNQQQQSNLTKRLQDIVDRYHRQGYFPDACVRVFNSRETLASACAGSADPASLFDVASLTKIATATQVLLLVSRGALSRHDRAADLFPPIAKNAFLNRRMGQVTLYQLLTHTSTLPDWYPFYSRKGEDFYSVLEYALAHTEPTCGMVYSDLNFMLLGVLLEGVRGKPLPRCLEEDLAVPLGLGEMLYRPKETRNIIPSCFGNPIEMDMCAERGISFDGFRPLGVSVAGTVNDGNCHYFFQDAAGHAGIFATAEAYQKLCQFYLNTDDALLLEAQREQKSAPGRGIGLQTGILYPHGCGHTGFTGTSIYFSREYDVGVVAFTNRLYFKERNQHNLMDFRRALHEAMFALCAQNPH